MIFVVFKKSMRKHIFETSNICFLDKTNVKTMLGYWPYAWKQNIFFNKHFFCWRKPGILIPDLYIYSIKIQTDIDQNTVIKITEKSQILWNNFWRIFIFYYYCFFLGWTQLGPRGWAQPSRPHVNSEITFHWIIFEVNSEIAFHCSSELYFTWTVKCKEMYSDEGGKPGGGGEEVFCSW
jgi:hypothetical protein